MLNIQSPQVNSGNGCTRIITKDKSISERDSYDKQRQLTKKNEIQSEAFERSVSVIRPALTVAEVRLAAGEPAGEEEEMVGVNIEDAMGEEAVKAEEPEEPALGLVKCAIGVSVVVLADVVVKPMLRTVG